MASAIDAFVTYKFLQILTNPWTKQEAFKHGIIDRKGKVLRKSDTLKTPQEKNSYTIFHRLIFNIKRIMEKLPFGKSRLGSFAAGLLLIKEESSEDTELYDFLNEEKILEKNDMQLYKPKINIKKGSYKLLNDMIMPRGGQIEKNDLVIYEGGQRTYNIFGETVIKVVHKKTNQNLFVGLNDIQKYENI